MPTRARKSKKDRPLEHVWKSDGLGGGHNGQYYYTCQGCGLHDWIASYGTESQLGDGKPCPGKKL